MGCRKNSLESRQKSEDTKKKRETQKTILWVYWPQEEPKLKKARIRNTKKKNGDVTIRVRGVDQR